MKIFDRWGELIFESDDIAAGWDGTFASHAVHDGIYLCVIRYSMDGDNYKTKKGKVVLIR
jgi:gliding motility-associated-like protein